MKRGKEAATSSKVSYSVERTAPAHERFVGIAAAADRHRRRAQGYQPLNLRSQVGLQTLVESRATVRSGQGDHHPPERRLMFYRSEAYGFSKEFMEYERDSSRAGRRDGGGTGLTGT